MCSLGHRLAAGRFSVLCRPPGIVETGWIARLLIAVTQFAVADVIDVRSPVVHRAAVSCESMPRQDDGMVVVGQHIFHLFLERASGHLHRLSSEVKQPALADIRSRDPTLT